MGDLEECFGVLVFRIWEERLNDWVLERIGLGFEKVVGYFGMFGFGIGGKLL